MKSCRLIKNKKTGQFKIRLILDLDDAGEFIFESVDIYASLSQYEADYRVFKISRLLGANRECLPYTEE